MAGRIVSADIETVRQRARIEDIVRETVTLKSAGSGSLKGLCPFHDERTPSFHVTPAKNLYHCFSCGEGGDIFDFVMKQDALTFTEAIEKLAGKYGVTLHYEESGRQSSAPTGQRTRLIEAHRAAESFYRKALLTPEAKHARDFLTQRGFDQAAIEHFGVGWSPAGWDGLVTHLKRLGFTIEDLITGGLAVASQRGGYDRFRDRLMWPIRDAAGETIGFGARKLTDADEGPKYLNTPETPIYRKSHVLYGLDLARRDIARNRQAVIVEGYTDVMACHLSGITTAVATCGTAFGSDHVRILRRLLLDQEDVRGELIFTFDGDAAGRKAALKAYGEDQNILANTFVAIESTGLDPCELWQTRGEQAVKDLIASRKPLFEFVLRSTIAEFDLSTAEGRVAAMRAAAPILNGIKDSALRPEYVRVVAGWIGVSELAFKAELAPERAKAKSSVPKAATSGQLERDVLKCVLQYPHLVGDWYDSLESSLFQIPAAAAVFSACQAAGTPGTSGWLDAAIAAAPEDETQRQIRALAVEPLPVDAPDQRYVQALLARLLERDAARRVAELKAALQQARDESGSDEEQLLADLIALENYRRQMHEYAVGDA